MMNECCQVAGNAIIQKSQNPTILFRVVCLYCGLIIHEQKRESSHHEESKESVNNDL